MHPLTIHRFFRTALLSIFALTSVSLRVQAQGFHQAAYDVSAPVQPHSYTDAEKVDQEKRGAALLQDMQARVKSGPVTYTVPPGVYRLTRGIDIHDSKGFHLNAAGCTFILVNTADAFVGGGNAENIAIIGPMTIDHDPYQLSQAVVKATDPASGIVTFQVMPGYSADIAAKGIGSLYMSNGTQIMLPSWSYYTEAKAVDAASRTYTMVAPKGTASLFAIGNLISLPINGSGPPFAFSFSLLHNFRLQDIQLGFSGALYSGGMPKGGDAQFIRIKNGRMPGTNRLASGPSTQAWNTGGTVLFDACEFGNSTDDLMDFQGSGQHMFYRTQPSNPRQIVTWNWFGGVGYSQGEKVAVYSHKNFATRSEATVISASSYVDVEMMKNALKVADASGSFHLNRHDASLTLVTLDKPVTGDPGDFLENLSQSAKLFTIRNCYFHDSAVQVMVEGFQRGVFTGNTFDHVNGGLALIANPYWPQGGAVSNIIVKNNVFKDCPYDTSWGSGVGALNIGAWWGDAPLAASESYSDKNINIIGNRFYQCAKSAIGIRMAQNITITGNQIDAALMQDGKGVIDLKLVGNARVSGNTMANCKGMALSLSNCVGVKAFDNTFNGIPRMALSPQANNGTRNGIAQK